MYYIMEYRFSAAKFDSVEIGVVAKNMSEAYDFFEQQFKVFYPTSYITYNPSNVFLVEVRPLGMVIQELISKVESM